VVTDDTKLDKKIAKAEAKDNDDKIAKTIAKDDELAAAELAADELAAAEVAAAEVAAADEPMVTDDTKLDDKIAKAEAKDDDKIGQGRGPSRSRGDLASPASVTASQAR